jgi:hypothetical protein
MSTITFNTLKFSQRLEKAGATREYAIAEAEALSEVFETGTQDLSTKGDINVVRSEIREMELRINSDFDRKLSPMRTELAVLKWMAGAGLGIGLTILFKLFH